MQYGILRLGALMSSWWYKEIEALRYHSLLWEWCVNAKLSLYRPNLLSRVNNSGVGLYLHITKLSSLQTAMQPRLSKINTKLSYVL